MNYVKHLTTPQTEALPNQVKNNAGGYVFELDPFKQLERFLILGSEGGTYYVGEGKLTRENARVVERCRDIDVQRTVETIASISETGRAAKNDPAIFALALLASSNCNTTRHSALHVLRRVCRTGTHLFQFVANCKELRGWGRSLREAVSNWYNLMPAEKLAYQVTKYRNRCGFTHRDVLRLAHPKALNTTHNNLYRYLTQGNVPEDDCLRLITGFEIMQKTTAVKTAVRLIEEFGLSREHVPNHLLSEKKVWEALLPKMPVTAMVRNLGKMSSIELLKPLSKATKHVRETLTDVDRLKKARVHPLSLLLAWSTYKNGRGFLGNLVWKPVPQIVGALEEAFYTSFESVEPTNKRHLLAIDVSGSMGWANIAGTHLKCNTAAACMAMVAMRTEPETHAVGFSHVLKPLNFNKTTSLNSVVSTMDVMRFGATDCAQPMLYALDNELEVDAFVILTDNETYCGHIHPCEALKKYRKASGIDAKLIVVGMVSTGFTIADPNDLNSLDICGFDAGVPKIMSEFVK